MKKVLNSLVILVLVISLTGCSGAKSRYVEPATVGGLTGAAAGAATGAVVGSAIANGDVIASAWLGAGIGLPVGALAAIYLQMEEEKTILEQNEEIINANRDQILAKDEYLKLMQRQVEQDLRNLNLNDVTPVDPTEEPYYLGPTIGVYR